MNRWIPITVLVAATLACSASPSSVQPVLPTETPRPQPSGVPTSAPTGAPMSNPIHTATPMATATAAPTSTPTSRPPTATPTRVTAVRPVPKLPEQGKTYQNPVVFRWDGTLGSGQVYVVRGTNPDKKAALESPPLSAATWTTHISPDKFGEWVWTVSVQQGSSILASSAEGRFWFNQFPDRRRP